MTKNTVAERRPALASRVNKMLKWPAEVEWVRLMLCTVAAPIRLRNAMCDQPFSLISP